MNKETGYSARDSVDVDEFIGFCCDCGMTDEEVSLILCLV